MLWSLLHLQHPSAYAKIIVLHRQVESAVDCRRSLVGLIRPEADIGVWWVGVAHHPRHRYKGQNNYDCSLLNNKPTAI
jgi:hypothetical protein